MFETKEEAEVHSTVELSFWDDLGQCVPSLKLTDPCFFIGCSFPGVAFVEEGNCRKQTLLSDT